MKRSIVLATLVLLLSLLLIVWRSSVQPRPVLLVPTLTGQEEYCLTCHADLPEISSSHPIQTFGCVICHGGERLALEADLAHSSMRGGRNPSDLAVVEASCGGSDCHSGDQALERDHIARVATSLQATYAGAIANIRYSFGAQSDLAAQQGIYAIQAAAQPAPGEPAFLSSFDPEADSSPAILAFAQNCLSCHLWAEALEGFEYSRLTGCAACHTPTAGRDISQPVHQLTTVIPYTQCNTCHNRGNYDLREMEFVPRSDHPTDRKNDYYQPIAQFTLCEYELDCVDCHTREEAMGDGHLYNNQAELQYVQCQTCHGSLTELPRTKTIASLDDIALRQVFLNPILDLQVGDRVIETERNEELWNVRQLEDGRFEMISKVTQIRYQVPLVMGSACEQNPEEQESNYCHECHAVER
jgi:hypothetical protein